MLTLYRFDSLENAGRWMVINDRVMGGISTSNMALSAEGTLLFAGHLSIENNGGFASIRSAPETFGLTDETGIRLTVRGDGKRYHFRLYDPELPRVAYEAPFDTVTGEWQVIDLPIQDFVPTIRGRVLTGYGSIAPQSIVSLGFILKDNQEGEFELAVSAIEAYR